mmetsp:Transcript_26254/g.72100  ORF Transcript_26254/g.72100 Transcript_26254/m.72100 type:complete len:155 (+) Transcript_26254:576-1040(+)
MPLGRLSTRVPGGLPGPFGGHFGIRELDRQLRLGPGTRADWIVRLSNQRGEDQSTAEAIARIAVSDKNNEASSDDTNGGLVQGCLVYAPYESLRCGGGIVDSLPTSPKTEGESTKRVFCLIIIDNSLEIKMDEPNNNLEKYGHQNISDLTIVCR